MNQSFTRGILLIFLSLSLLALLSCEEGDNAATPGPDQDLNPTDGDSETACILDSECPEGWLCQAGACVLQAESPCLGENGCIADSECGVGRYCADTCQCEKKIPDSCTSDAECPETQVCHNGRCIAGENNPCAASGDCAKDSDCGAAMICDDACVCVSVNPDGDLEDELDLSDEEYLPDPCDQGPQMSAPTELDFGYVPYNTEAAKSINLCNTCDRPLVISAIEILESPSDYRLLSPPTEAITLAKKNDCYEQRVVYRPHDIGEDGATVVITSNDSDGATRVLLKSHYKGRNDLEVTPNPLDFQSVVVNDPPAERTLILHNKPGLDPQDNAILRVNGVDFGSETHSAFELAAVTTPFYLGQGQEKELTLRCRPQRSGEFEETLHIDSNDPDTQDYTVTLRCKGVEPILSVATLNTSNELDFGLQRVNAKVTVNLSLSNSGGGTLIVEPPMLVTGSSVAYSLDTSVFDNGNVSLSAGQSVTLPVTYFPADAATHTGQIRIPNNTFGSQTFMVGLKGRAAAASVVVAPNPLTFSDTRVGEHEDLTLTFTNIGEVPVTLLEIALASVSDALSFDTADILVDILLDPTESHVVHVTFAPPSRGTFNNTVHFATDDAIASAGDVPVNAKGIAPVLEIRETGNPDFTDTVDFKEVRLNKRGECTLEIANTGDAPMRNLSLELTANSPDNEFTLTPLAVAELAAGQKTTALIAYEPKNFPGHDGGSLLLVADVPFAGEQVIQLSGLGINPKLLFSPALQLDFIDTHYGAHRTARTTLFNIGDVGKLVVYGVEIAMGDQSFSLNPLEQALPYELNPSDPQSSLAVDVVFNPQDPAKGESPPATFSGALRVTTNSYIQEITLYPLNGKGVPCPNGMWDLDGNPEDCEYPCWLSEGGHEICDGKDNDCNGMTDDGAGVTSNCAPPPNAKAVCTAYGACDFLCNQSYHRCQNLCYADNDATHCGLDCVPCQDDGLDCTGTVCTLGLCGHEILISKCLIDEVCYENNDPDVPSGCRVCNPFYSQTSWKNKPNGITCDDGHYCSINETCQNGQCLSTTARDCSSAVTVPECQLPDCDENARLCKAKPANDGADCRQGSNQDGWYLGGDVGPGCLMLDDPSGERRDYGCAQGACAYTVAETLDCDLFDGFYGGGNTAGCGVDPSSVQRDYFTTSNGQCQYVTQNCQSIQCDLFDRCTTVCEGSVVRANDDYYVEADGSTCKHELGQVVEDCAQKASTDSDGSSSNYLEGGTVTDYTGCNNGACSTQLYRDYCGGAQGTTLFEYGADGAGVAGPFEHDCQLSESTYCTGRYQYRDEWTCLGFPANCSAAAPDTLVADCGINGCEGSCGASLNGCTYHQRGCDGGQCLNQSHDADMSQEYCTACGRVWAIGGNVDPEGCCGDDLGENLRYCTDNSDNGDCGADTSACCASASDCVTHLGQCARSAACGLFGGLGKKSYCDGTAWQDPDDAAAYCVADGCEYDWMPNLGKCCGDDGGEDLEQNSGDCCYNGEKLENGSASASILCQDGQLYDCNGVATDDSGLGTHKTTCDNVGSLYCSENDTWSDALLGDCPCSHDEECSSGYCKADYDGVGRWCAEAGECAHNGAFYTEGAYAPDCFDAGNRARCLSGAWNLESCGVDTTCADYVCSAGACGVSFALNTVQCDSAYKCSPGAGDGLFGQGGAWRCQGYCDGAGNCDQAGHCENCDNRDGWTNTGDLGPGCVVMADPVAERRDYGCNLGVCEYTVQETQDCNVQDGYTGGGDTAGCGNDASSQQRDYYADASGNCVFTTTGCASLDCDNQDACGQICDGSVLKAYKDYYVPTGTGTCTFVYGASVEDCATKTSTDSDGSATAYKVGGTVVDYTGCSAGACSFNSYADYCQGSEVYEYGVNGSDITGPSAYDCQNYESLYCDGARLLKRDEWTCSGSPGFCSDAPDTTANDCGVSGCEGSCGSGTNGCAYHARGCSNAACTNSTSDADSAQAYCTSCGLGWALGGEIAASSCCGDDAGEVARTCTDSSDNGDCGADTSACCSLASDCVLHDGSCTDSGSCYSFGTAGKKSYCNSGAWEDPDDASIYCTATGCGYTWMAVAAKCCGDESGEDFEQSSGACCYNGAQLANGSSSGSILCSNGLLYDCKGLATDDSGLADNKNVCDAMGSLYCRGDGTWGATMSNGCACTGAAQCTSNSCKSDYDGTGSWCAGSTECEHNGTAYASGQNAPDCLDGSNARQCVSGSWNTVNCGTDTACTDYSCSSGSCNVNYYGSATQCNSTWSCSNGAGDNKYGTGGSYRCQAYCDGSGYCDYAGNCDDCQDNFPGGTGTCSSGSCSLSSCNYGYADCDTNHNDCEVNLNDGGGVCANATSLGSLHVNIRQYIFCSSNVCDTGPHQGGHGERWFKINTVEDTTACSDGNKLLIRLQSPASHDYDLYLYDSCGHQVASSTYGSGLLDSITYEWGHVGDNNERWFWVEIRFYEGSSCADWTLDFKGGCPSGW